MAKYLCADIGGTHTRFKVFEYSSTSKKIKNSKEIQFLNSDHSSFESAFLYILSTIPYKLNAISLAAAGPVDQKNTSIELTNIKWSIQKKWIQKVSKCREVVLLNDLEALAWGIAKNHNKKNSLDKKSIQNTKSISNQNIAILSIGTGHGQALLFSNLGKYQISPCEGGHCSLSPNTTLQIQMLSYLQNLYSHVSWDRVVSGSGIRLIYDFLIHHHNLKNYEHDFINQLNAHDATALICQRALATKNKDDISRECLDLFFSLLAIEASNLALKTNCFSGLYLCGGVLNKISPLFQKDKFIFDFLNKGRSQNLLKNIPIYLLNDQGLAIEGAFYALLSKKGDF